MWLMYIISTEYTIPCDVLPVAHGGISDIWDCNDITDIDPEILDASVEASEIFDEFLKAGEEELSTQHLIASDDTTKHSNGLSTVTAYTSSSSSCCSSSSNM